MSDDQLESFLALRVVDAGLLSLKIPAPSETVPTFPRDTARCLCARFPLMKTVRRLGVRIDICPDCRAVWLDGGELLLLAERASRAKNKDT